MLGKFIARDFIAIAGEMHRFPASNVHETWWSYRYMFLVGPKVFSFVVKGIKVIC
jgi:hypothetical protein